MPALLAVFTINQIKFMPKYNRSGNLTKNQPKKC